MPPSAGPMHGHRPQKQTQWSRTCNQLYQRWLGSMGFLLAEELYRGIITACAVSGFLSDRALGAFGMVYVLAQTLRAIAIHSASQKDTRTQAHGTVHQHGGGAIASGSAAAASSHARAPRLHPRPACLPWSVRLALRFCHYAAVWAFLGSVRLGGSANPMHSPVALVSKLLNTVLYAVHPTADVLLSCMEVMLAQASDPSCPRRFMPPSHAHAMIPYPPLMQRYCGILGVPQRFQAYVNALLTHGSNRMALLELAGIAISTAALSGYMYSLLHPTSAKNHRTSCIQSSEAQSAGCQKKQLPTMSIPASGVGSKPGCEAAGCGEPLTKDSNATPYSSSCSSKQMAAGGWPASHGGAWAPEAHTACEAAPVAAPVIAAAAAPLTAPAAVAATLAGPAAAASVQAVCAFKSVSSLSAAPAACEHAGQEDPPRPSSPPPPPHALYACTHTAVAAGSATPLLPAEPCLRRITPYHAPPQSNPPTSAAAVRVVPMAMTEAGASASMQGIDITIATPAAAAITASPAVSDSNHVHGASTINGTSPTLAHASLLPASLDYRPRTHLQLLSVKVMNHPGTHTQYASQLRCHAMRQVQGAHRRAHMPVQPQAQQPDQLAPEAWSLLQPLLHPGQQQHLVLEPQAQLQAQAPGSMSLQHQPLPPPSAGSNLHAWNGTVLDTTFGRVMPPGPSTILSIRLPVRVDNEHWVEPGRRSALLARAVCVHGCVQLIMWLHEVTLHMQQQQQPQRQQPQLPAHSLQAPPIAAPVSSRSSSPSATTYASGGDDDTHLTAVAPHGQSARLNPTQAAALAMVYPAPRSSHDDARVGDLDAWLHASAHASQGAWTNSASEVAAGFPDAVGPNMQSVLHAISGEGLNASHVSHSSPDDQSIGARAGSSSLAVSSSCQAAGSSRPVGSSSMPMRGSSMPATSADGISSEAAAPAHMEGLRRGEINDHLFLHASTSHTNAAHAGVSYAAAMEYDPYATWTSTLDLSDLLPHTPVDTPQAQARASSAASSAPTPLAQGQGASVARMQLNAIGRSAPSGSTTLQHVSPEASHVRIVAVPCPVVFMPTNHAAPGHLPAGSSSREGHSGASGTSGTSGTSASPTTPTAMEIFVHAARPCTVRVLLVLDGSLLIEDYCAYLPAGQSSLYVPCTTAGQLPIVHGAALQLVLLPAAVPHAGNGSGHSEQAPHADGSGSRVQHTGWNGQVSDSSNGRGAEAGVAADPAADSSAIDGGSLQSAVLICDTVTLLCLPEELAAEMLACVIQPALAALNGDPAVAHAYLQPVVRDIAYLLTHAAHVQRSSEQSQAHAYVLQADIHDVGDDSVAWRDVSSNTEPAAAAVSALQHAAAWEVVDALVSYMHANGATGMSAHVQALAATAASASASTRTATVTGGPHVAGPAPASATGGVLRPAAAAVSQVLRHAEFGNTPDSGHAVPEWATEPANMDSAAGLEQLVPEALRMIALEHGDFVLEDMDRSPAHGTQGTGREAGILPTGDGEAGMHPAGAATPGSVSVAVAAAAANTALARSLLRSTLTTLITEAAAGGQTSLSVALSGPNYPRTKASRVLALAKASLYGWSGQSLFVPAPAEPFELAPLSGLRRRAEGGGSSSSMSSSKSDAVPKEHACEVDMEEHFCQFYNAQALQADALHACMHAAYGAAMLVKEGRSLTCNTALGIALLALPRPLLFGGLLWGRQRNALVAKILNLYRNEISAISMLLHAYTVCMMCATLLGPKESLLNVYTGSMLVHVVGDGVLAAFFMQVRFKTGVLVATLHQLLVALIFCPLLPMAMRSLTHGSAAASAAASIAAPCISQASPVQGVSKLLMGMFRATAGSCSTARQQYSGAGVLPVVAVHQLVPAAGTMWVAPWRLCMAWMMGVITSLALDMRARARFLEHLQSSS